MNNILIVVTVIMVIIAVIWGVGWLLDAVFDFWED